MADKLTSAWVKPLLAKLRAVDPDFVISNRIMRESMIPATETADMPGVRKAAIDWIGVGQRIIDELGLENCPPQP